MVSHYTAKVARGQVVIHDVDLPNGTTVRVQIEPAMVAPPFRTREEVEADMRASEREFRRGEWVTGEESLVLLREFNALLVAGHRPSTEISFPSRHKVARKPRKRAKPARKRAR
jgi:hypothetical protein